MPVTSTPLLQTQAEQLRQYVRDEMKLNPEQSAACWAPLAGQGVQVLAGAGTGKTWLIAARFLSLLASLLEQGVPFPESRLLVLTFTEKAAGEMRERIHKHLQKAGYTGGLPVQTITTFHSFGHWLVQRHASDLGLSAPVQLADETARQGLLEQLTRLIEQGSLPSIASSLEAMGLNDELPADVLSLERLSQWPGLKKADWLASFPFVLERIKAAGLTPKAFYQEATRQSEAWQTTLLTLPTTDPVMGTPLESKERLAKVWAEHVSAYASESWLLELMEPDAEKGSYYTNLLEALWDNRVVNKPPSNSKKPLTFPPDKSELEAELGQQLALEKQLVEAIAGFYALYQHQLQLRNSADFNDLINHAVTLLATRPSLRQTYQQWFQAVLVDEFQDTNGSQLQLLQAIARQGEACNLTVVGDAKQSIYGFRYAQKENLELAFQQSPYEPVTLQNNYRSTEAVLAVANTVALDLTYGDKTQQLLPNKASSFTNRPSIRLYSLGRWFPKPNVKKESYERENADSVLRKQSQLLALEVAQQLTQHGRQPQDIAILVRAHNKGARLAESLNELGIPVIRSRDQHFFREPVIQQAWLGLRLLINPADRPAWVGLLSPHLHPQRLETLLGKQKEAFVPHQRFERVDDSALKHWLMGLLQALTTAREEVTLLKAMARWLSEGQPMLEGAAEGGERNNRFAGLLQEQWLGLLEQAQKHVGFEASWQETLDWLNEQSQSRDVRIPLPPGHEKLPAVQLLTMHAAKGLEFPVVYVSWTDKNPSRGDGPLVFDPQFEGRPGFGLMLNKTRQQEDNWKLKVYKTLWTKPRQQEEDKRLFYVALTRAKEELVLFRLSDNPDRNKSPNESTLPLPPNATGFVKHWNEAEFQDADELDTLLSQAPWQQLRQQLSQHLPPIPASEALLSDTREQSPINKSLVSSKALLPTLSFTALQRFEACELAYWYGYLQGLPQPKADEAATTKGNLAAAQGQVLHRWVQAHYLTQGHLPKHQAEQWLTEAVSPFTPPEQQQVSAWVKGAYEQFQRSRWAYEALRAEGWQIIAPEVKVHLQWPAPPSWPEADKQLTIVGQVDALLVKPQQQRYQVLDFKTNRQLTEEKRRDYFYQLELYRAGLHQSNPQSLLAPEDIQLVHLQPQEQPVAYALAQQAETPDLSRWLNPLLARMAPHWLQANRMPEPPTDPPCQQCAYLSVCPKATA